mmetsp:Transcript_97429/g.270992  ORF Transcript_97429/g.270992 Transcript_97429/m.270992 type:complete len:188 (+) Transcript_97429:93-656(+)
MRRAAFGVGKEELAHDFLDDREGGHLGAVASLESCIEVYHANWRLWFRLLSGFLAAVHLFYLAGRYLGDSNVFLAVFASHPLAATPRPEAIALLLEGASMSLLPTVLLDLQGRILSMGVCVAVLAHLALWCLAGGALGIPVGPLLVPAIMAPIAWVMLLYLCQAMSGVHLHLEELRHMADGNHQKGS